MRSLSPITRGIALGVAEAEAEVVAAAEEAVVVAAAAAEGGGAPLDAPAPFVGVSVTSGPPGG